MKAQVIKKFGDASVFELVDLPKPELKPGHVLIKVCAKSLNQIDGKIRSGAVPALSPKFSAILNSDVAGVIDSIGPLEEITPAHILLESGKAKGKVIILIN